MKLLFQIIKKIWKSKRYVIITENDEIIDIQYSDNDIDWKSSIINKLNSNFIEEVTPEVYGRDLQKYNEELFNAYKECDYQMAKSNYLEAELEYQRAVNDPSGGDANKLYMMYSRLKKLKEIYENFE